MDLEIRKDKIELCVQLGKSSEPQVRHLQSADPYIKCMAREQHEALCMGMADSLLVVLVLFFFTSFLNKSVSFIFLIFHCTQSHKNSVK